MRTLTRVARETAGTPQQLPVVFPALSEAGIRPRRSTVTMVAATPAFTSKAGKDFKMWTCPNQRSKGDGHYSEFIK